MNRKTFSIFLIFFITAILAAILAGKFPNLLKKLLDCGKQTG